MNRIGRRTIMCMLHADIALSGSSSRRRYSLVSDLFIATRRKPSSVTMRLPSTSFT
jgi:hypothetical protein